MTLSKEDIRQEAMKHRDRIDPVTEDPDEACDIFFESIKPDPSQSVALYWPIGRELDTLPLMERLIKAGHVVALPVVKMDERVLLFARYQEGDELIKGPYDILQPAINDKTELIEPDIFIVPLLAFDRHGYRLGYGGGYYDATLAALRAKKEITAVGWACGIQAVLFNLPREDHDIPMDWIITPQKPYRFN
jgi:5-formyltetrahydrofolate cyclo-ligase